MAALQGRATRHSMRWQSTSFGGNASSAKMQMTTPVFTDDRGAMQFVIDPSFQVGALNCLVRGQ